MKRINVVTLSVVVASVLLALVLLAPDGAGEAEAQGSGDPDPLLIFRITQFRGEDIEVKHGECSEITAVKNSTGRILLLGPGGPPRTRTTLQLADGTDTVFVCDDTAIFRRSTMTNRAPIANNDNAFVPLRPVTIMVAANDVDPENYLALDTANTECSECAEAAHGTLINNHDGTFFYTPDPLFTGDDSFVYEICDAHLSCDTAHVFMLVAPD